jgi:8-oxo-dGTP pyrophosphatase MutT (NUDIX family)
MKSDDDMRPDGVEMVIPAERLPPGFAQRIGESVTHPAEPQPAATAVLMRDGAEGIEILLLKRHRASGFVPGAYVFAGGRVDDADDDPWIAERIGAASERAAPPLAFWVATIREVFEESGVLLARDAAGRPVPSTSAEPRVAELREGLMTGGVTFRDVMQTLDVVPDLAAMAYSAHWITPLAEARRYDTRFFYAAMPPGCEATADAREMSDAIWLTPAEALERFHAARLPMVFPTVKTIEGLLSFPDVATALADARSCEIKPILPRLVRVQDGVGIVIDAGASARDKNKGMEL